MTEQQTEKILSLEEIDYQHFWGQNDRMLDFVRLLFPKLKLIVRGEMLKAIGSAEDIEWFENRLQAMTAYYERYGHLNENAVMQDLTRETIQDRYPDVAIIPPQRAAEHLFAIAQKNDFTLYEFFQTDVAGHSMDYARACSVLRTYDLFLSALVRYTDAAGITLLMTADHGNIEAMAERGHTRNPVPFIAFGPGEAEFRAHVKSLVDVTPAILRFI